MKTKSILGLAALAAVTSVAVNGVVRTSSAQNAAKPLAAQDLLDIRQLIDGYSHILDNCTNNGNDYAEPLHGRRDVRRVLRMGQGEDLVPRPRAAAARRWRHGHRVPAAAIAGLRVPFDDQPRHHGDADGRARNLDAADDHERHERPRRHRALGRRLRRYVRENRRRLALQVARPRVARGGSGPTASRTCRRASSRTSSASVAAERGRAGGELHGRPGQTACARDSARR